VTSSHEARKAAQSAGRELKPLLKRLLACIAEVEVDGWDIDWVRLPKRYASAVLTDIEAALVEPGTAKEAAQRVELLGSELALRRWLAGDTRGTEFDVLASGLLDPLSSYRAHLRALGAREPAT
jgi:hypothetical protein